MVLISAMPRTIGRSVRRAYQLRREHWGAEADEQVGAETKADMIEQMNRTRDAMIEQYEGCKSIDSQPLRWEGDSNPRYGYPYVSLANWWFQPLTHLTSENRLASNHAFALSESRLAKTNVLFLKADAKVLLFFETAKLFGHFFSQKTKKE